MKCALEMIMTTEDLRLSAFERLEKERIEREIIEKEKQRIKREGEIKRANEFCSILLNEFEKVFSNYTGRVEDFTFEYYCCDYGEHNYLNVIGKFKQSKTLNYADGRHSYSLYDTILISDIVDILEKNCYNVKVAHRAYLTKYYYYGIGAYTTPIFTISFNPKCFEN